MPVYVCQWCQNLSLLTTASVSTPSFLLSPTLPLPLPLPHRVFVSSVAGHLNERFGVSRPPALRTFPSYSSAGAPTFAAIVAKYTPPLNVVRTGGLQILRPPPLTPSRMATQQSASLPSVPMTVAPVMLSLPAATPSFPVPNVIRPPPLRMHLSSALPQFSEPVTTSVLAARPILAPSSSVQPLLLPPLQLHVSRFSSVPIMPVSAMPSYQTASTVFSPSNSVRPMLQLHLSGTAPTVIGRSAVRPQSSCSVPISVVTSSVTAAVASTDFSCFTVSSTRPPLVIRPASRPFDVLAAISSVSWPSVSTSTGALSHPSSTLSMSRPSVDTPRSASHSFEVIEVDDDSEPTDATAVSLPVQLDVEPNPAPSTTSSSNAVSHCVTLSSRNSFEHLHAAFDSLQHIFQYLDICTRLRAAQVCRCWHRMSTQQHLVCYFHVLFYLCC